MKYLGNTFSPLMLADGGWAEVVEIELTDVPYIKKEGVISVVGHEVTAKILSVLLEEDIPFNRVNLTLVAGDTLFCVIPNFRSNEAREFTYEEVANAGYRVFQVCPFKEGGI